MNGRAVDDDVVAKAAVGGTHAGRALGEDAPVVPYPVGVPAQVDERLVHDELSDEQALVEDVARVVRDLDGAGADEEGVLLVANGERVDDDAGDQAAGDAPDVHLSALAELRRDLCLEVPAHVIAAKIRLRHRQHRCRHADSDEEQHGGADDGDETATGHG